MHGPARTVSRYTIPLLGALALFPSLAVWFQSVGNPLDYLGPEFPPGQGLYVVSKLLGLMALSLLWLQCLTALAQHSPTLVLLRPRFTVHRFLGLLALTCAALHAALFVTAASLRTGQPALGLLAPLPGQGYYGLHVSLGAMALWLLALVPIAGLWRLRAPGWWRWIHWSWLPALALICLHGLGIGSESRFGLLRHGYLLMAASLATAALVRVGAVLRRNRPT